MAEHDYQADLDAASAERPRTREAILEAIGVAVSDALGPHGGQPELRQRWRLEHDRGRRLQVEGYIHLATLRRVVARQVLDLLMGWTSRDALADVFYRVLTHDDERGALPPDLADPGVLAEDLADAVMALFELPGESFDEL